MTRIPDEIAPAFQKAAVPRDEILRLELAAPHLLGELREFYRGS